MLTIDTWLGALDRQLPAAECPLWPPDLFAIAGALLKRSGAYLLIFEHRDRYLVEARAIGENWRNAIDGLKRPDRKALRQARPGRPSFGAATNWSAKSETRRRYRKNSFAWALIADEASAGIGVDYDGPEQAPSTFLSLADAFLRDSHSLSFCWEVPANLICVLGKQHTPQRGATFRSLSHHLALHLPTEIEARWIGPLRKQTAPHSAPGSLNLLLLPWPTHIESKNFVETRDRSGSRAGYLSFHPSNDPTPAGFARALRRALHNAKKHAARIDAIVLPELALNEEQFDAAEQIAFQHRAILICGVRVPRPNRQRRDLNLSVLQPAGILRDVTLDRMTWSVLVCEDLARQDPAADIIRAVGPNLLIALLMDGPQLAGRWSSRYASVLAEDPGTSVLTLTNLGMVERCRPMLPNGRRADSSRVVALWRDAVAGEIEIALDAGDDACVDAGVPAARRIRRRRQRRRHPGAISRLRRLQIL